MIDYTVDRLVEDVKTTASVPAAQPRFSTDGIVRIMTRVLQAKIVPMMMTAREEYFVDYDDQTIVQGNTTGYPIPSDAVGMKVRDVVLVNQSGLLNLTGLPRLSLEQVSGYYFGQVVPFGFFIQNNNVILWPVNQTTPSNTIRIYYLRRTNMLTSTDHCGKVTAILGNVLTLTNVPTDWTTSTVVNAIDPLPGFNTLARDRAITNLSGFDVTLDDVTGITRDSWIAENGLSPIPQVPVEVHQLLVQGTALEILKSLGNTEGYQKLEFEYKQMTGFVFDSITPRADGNPKKCISAGNGIADWCGFRWRS
ncbi:MAG: hypothetical protein IPI28_18930 [Candidatus Omnitrophica bacterium]|nr:hypothetical protein [Candidatus Omnitrophota bacterium]